METHKKNQAEESEDRLNGKRNEENEMGRLVRVVVSGLEGSRSQIAEEWSWQD